MPTRNRRELFARTAKRWRRLAVLAVALGVTLTVATAPAHAVPNPFTRAMDSASNSNTTKSISVSCPTDTKVYGAMASIEGGFGNVVLDDIIPSANLTSVTATAAENGAYAENWHVTAKAICGGPTTNLRRFPEPSTFDTFPDKGAIAYCPDDTRLYGTGAEITGGQGNVFLHTLIPDVDNDRVIAAAAVDEVSNVNWGITAYAICGAAPAILRMHSSPSVSDSNSPKQTSQLCAVPGTKSHGVGFEFQGTPGGPGIAGELVLNNLETSGGGVASSSVTAYENGSVTTNWSVRTFNVCAT